MKKFIPIFFLVVFTSGIFSDTMVIELKNGEKAYFETEEIGNIYYVNQRYDLEYKNFGSYEVLKPLTGVSVEITFSIKPYNSENQVWFGGICGPDLKGGLGVFVYNGNIYLRAGNSCTDRIPNQFAEVVLPLSAVKLNEWNDIKIKYETSSELSISINGSRKFAYGNIPSKVPANKVYIGTDPRHPGSNYNFKGEIKNLKY